MKKLNLSFLYTAILLLCIVSCTKEKINPPPVTIVPVQQSKELNILVTNWSTDQDKQVSTFSGILRYGSPASGIKVYAVMNITTGDVLISNGAISYQGGELWAEQSGYDLKIVFRPNYPSQNRTPGKLAIKIVFEP